MKTKCPKCKEDIEINIGALMGSVKSEAKSIAARKRALKYWKNRKKK